MLWELYSCLQHQKLCCVSPSGVNMRGEASLMYNIIPGKPEVAAHQRSQIITVLQWKNNLYHD